jgi:DNA-3-methyladenine glycosylase
MRWNSSSSIVQRRSSIVDRPASIVDRPASIVDRRSSSVRSAIRLPRAFYARPTLEVAADLLGKVLVHRTRAGVTSGIIVEVEAYVGESDPACHAAPGPTKRNTLMYGPPGHAYVYLNYGVHYLVNIVTEPKLYPAAVLIRALEPLEGVGLMRKRRMRSRTARHQNTAANISDHALCKGPGNVTHAMGITLQDNGTDLLGNTLFLEDRGYRIEEVCWGPRIGITVGIERPWRCYAEGHLSVSGKSLKTIEPQRTQRKYKEEQF